MIEAYWQEVFDRIGLVYLEKPRIAHPDHDKYDRTRSLYYRQHRQTFERALKRYLTPLRKAMVAPTELRFLGDDIGYGLFARVRIPRGGWIGEYTGVIRKAVAANRHNMVDGHYLTDYAITYPRPLPNGTILEVDALKEGNPLRFANHSFKPNASVDHLLFENRWVTFFRARRTIEAGEEIRINYGMDYWTGGFRTLVLDQT